MKRSHVYFDKEERAPSRVSDKRHGRRRRKRPAERRELGSKIWAIRSAAPSPSFRRSASAERWWMSGVR